MLRPLLLIALLLALGCSRPIGAARVDLKRQSAFQRGVGLGLFASQADYDYKQLLDELVLHGATDVLVVVAWYQADVLGHEITPRETFSPSDATVLRTLKQAKARGLRVSLLPIVRLTNRAADQWRGKIAPAAGKDVWFASYQRYIVRMAKLASEAKIERFSVGSELLSLEREREHWLKLIAEVRAHYRGKLFYSANWDHFDPVSFWDAVDEVGVTAYFELVKDGEAPTAELLVERWSEPRAQLATLRARTAKPVIITEVGYPSKTTAARYPWDETRAAPLDFALQAKLYRAFCDAWSSRAVVDGVYFWNWFGWGGLKDGEYTPRGKPAALELRECFEREWPAPKPLTPGPILTNLRHEDRPMRACSSCGNETNQPNYCEQCGAALAPVEVVEDTALSLMLGLVCPKCDSYNEPQTEACVMCGSALEEESGQNRPPSTPAPASAAPPTWMSAPDGAPLMTADAMPAVSLATITAEPSGKMTPPKELPELEPIVAKCSSCGEQLEGDDKFCRSCGAKVDVKATMMISQTGGGVAVGQPGPAATQVLAAVSPAGVALPVPQPAPDGGGASTLFFGAVSVQRFARLVLVKGSSDDGAHWKLAPGETTIGRAGQVRFSADDKLADVQCRVIFNDVGVELHPVEPVNGVFVSIAHKINLSAGDEFVVGTQRMLLLDESSRSEVVPPRTDDTTLLGSMMPGAANIMMRRIFAVRGLEEVYVRAQRLLTIGRNLCDVNFPTDPYLSVRHAQIARAGTGYVLEDLGSRNGTYVRVRRPHALKHGDAIMIGDQVLRVELSG